MTIHEVVSGLPAVYLTPELPDEPQFKRQIHGGYACDMLSLVISGVNPEEVWFTILNSMNVVAVAVLSECALVVLTEGVTMEPDVILRATEKGIVVVSTQISTYAACVRLNALLNALPVC
jgi:hypothetical protein